MSVSFNSVKLSPGGTFQPMVSPSSTTARQLFAPVNTQLNNSTPLGLNLDDKLFDNPGGGFCNWG
jgi:hypothetical protein